MDYKDQLLERIQKEQDALDGLKRLIDRIPEDLPYIFSTFLWTTFYADSGAQLSMPYDLVKFNEIRAVLESAGFTETVRRTRTGAGDLSINFKMDDSQALLEIILTPSVPGASCTRKVIDYIKEPVYEIVCNASEMATSGGRG